MVTACMRVCMYTYVCIYIYIYIYDPLSAKKLPLPEPWSSDPAAELHSSEQFWMYLNLGMVAPQTFAMTFAKPGFRLY